MPAGQQLKTLRNKRNITVREVEQASRRIADAKRDKRFCISNGWLAQLENGASEPSICKLFSLSVIYRANFLDLVRLYNVDVDEKEKYESVANPSHTQLLVLPNGDDELPEIANGNEALDTGLFPEVKADDVICGHLGLTDFTMYPMIRPGAVVTINTSQNKLSTVAWRNEYERPIFFIELRDAYACGWCELQGNQLLVIPHPSSPASVRRYSYPREAEIVGRVVGYRTPCIDPQPEEVQKVRTASARIR
ncbi:MAG TPA: helix-turn-helix transcriptional regulator [Pyrinomonadaceae bacterium]